MKKFISILLTLVLMLSLASACVFAVDETDQMIIKNSAHDHNIMVTSPKLGASLGSEVNVGGVPNYVGSNGITSAIIEGDGITWIQEECLGKKSWYGLDNSAGQFKDGSVFWAQYLNKMEDFLEYDRVLDRFGFSDDYVLKNIVRFGIVDPEGNPYTKIEAFPNLYVEIGDQWDKSDMQATFAADECSEHVDRRYEITYCPEGRQEFWKVKIEHLSETMILVQPESDRPFGAFGTIISDYQPVIAIVLASAAALAIYVVVSKKKR